MSTLPKVEIKQIIVVGCGRVGAELALALWRQHHNITVVDVNAKSFDRLGLEFSGRTVQGEAIDLAVLKRAGIEGAHAFAAATTSDSVNIVAGRIARTMFDVPHVVARVYNPRRAPIYAKLGLQTITSSSWAAQRMEQIILHPGLQSIAQAGNGEVQIYEISVPHEWDGRRLDELCAGEGMCVVALARGGRAALPVPGQSLQEHDLIHVSATAAGSAVLRQRLQENGKG